MRNAVACGGRRATGWRTVVGRIAESRPLEDM